MRLSKKDRLLDPRVNWLATAARLRAVGDRIGYRECLRLVRVLRNRKPQSPLAVLAGKEARL